jgi:hypothetical protein
VLPTGRLLFGFRLDPPPGRHAKNDPLSQLMRLQINTFAFLKGSTEGAGKYAQAYIRGAPNCHSKYSRWWVYETTEKQSVAGKT